MFGSTANGQMQLLAGLVEQTRKLIGKDPYDYGGPNGVQDASDLRGFSKESQAQIIMELWKSQHGYRTDRKDVPFTPIYVDSLRRLVQAAGLGTSDPRRRTVGGSLDAAIAKVANLLLSRLD